MEFSAETSVYPEVEDAVEETIGCWQPYHYELDPLGCAATGDCCGTENMAIQAKQVFRQTVNIRLQLLTGNSR